MMLRTLIAISIFSFSLIANASGYYYYSCTTPEDMPIFTNGSALEIDLNVYNYGSFSVTVTQEQGSYNDLEYSETLEDGTNIFKTSPTADPQYETLGLTLEVPQSLIDGTERSGSVKLSRALDDVYSMSLPYTCDFKY